MDHSSADSSLIGKKAEMMAAELNNKGIRGYFSIGDVPLTGMAEQMNNRKKYQVLDGTNLILSLVLNNRISYKFVSGLCNRRDDRNETVYC